MMDDLLNDYSIKKSVLCLIGAILVLLCASFVTRFDSFKEHACKSYILQLRNYLDSKHDTVEMGDFINNYRADFKKLSWINKDCIVTWGLDYSNNVFDYDNLVSACYGNDYKRGHKDMLGRDYKEIASSFIVRMKAFETSHKSYADGEKRFERLGLEAKQWKEAHDNVYFDFNGYYLYLRIEPGFSFKVKDVQGRWRILMSNSGWPMIYNVKTNKWYFKSEHEMDEVKFETAVKIRNGNV